MVVGSYGRAFVLGSFRHGRRSGDTVFTVFFSSSVYYPVGL